MLARLYVCIYVSYVVVAVFSNILYFSKTPPKNKCTIWEYFYSKRKYLSICCAFQRKANGCM